jgi:hypothetical protein
VVCFDSLLVAALGFFAGVISVFAHLAWDAPQILLSETASAAPLIVGGPKMLQRTIRFADTIVKSIREATAKRGFSSPTVFIRHAVEQELSGHKEELANAEQRLAAIIEQVRQELGPLGRTQQALFALVDSLAKVVLTCVPELSGEAREVALATAQRRHARLVKRRPIDERRFALGNAGAN